MSRLKIAIFTLFMFFQILAIQAEDVDTDNSTNVENTNDNQSNSPIIDSPTTDSPTANVPTITSPTANVPATTSPATSSLTITPDSANDLIKVDLKVNKVKTTTKEPIELTLRFSYPKDANLQTAFPEIAELLNKIGFRITSATDVETKNVDNRTEQQKKYTLMADFEGSYIIPPMEIKIQEANKTEPTSKKTSQLFIEVVSFLNGENAPKDIRDIKPTILQPFPIYWLIGSILTLIILIITGIGIYFYLKRQRLQKDDVIIIPLEERVLELLEQLKSKEISTLEDMQMFYFNLTELAKAYLEERFGFGATDLTTEELQRELKHHRQFTSVQTNELNSFFVRADQTKFAKHTPSAQIIIDDWSWLKDFVIQTTPQTSQPDITQAEPDKTGGVQ